MDRHPPDAVAFRLVTYAAYDLTNQALTRDWPVLVTLVDLVWGAVLTAAVSVATFAIARKLGDHVA